MLEWKPEKSNHPSAPNSPGTANSSSATPRTSFSAFAWLRLVDFSEPDTSDGLEIMSNHQLIYPGCSYFLNG